MQSQQWPRGWIVTAVLTLVVLVASSLAFVRATLAAQAVDDLEVVRAVTQTRETCYSTPECPNVDALMALFAPDARRTEIQRNNNVVLLESAEALREDHLRVARMFPGRRLETTSMQKQGRNVVVLQSNWDPGAPEPNPFVSVFRIQDGKVAHWVLIAP